MFQPAPLQFTVSGSRNDVNFQVIGWSDDFSDPNSGWDDGFIGAGDDSYVKYKKDETAEDLYEIFVKDVASSIKVLAPLVMPSSYSLKVTGYTYSGAGMYGLVFNVKSFQPGEYYYVFRVRPQDGYYQLIKVDIFHEETGTTEIINGYNSIFTDSGINMLEVRVNWNKVELCVNNVVVHPNPVEITPQAGDFVQAGLYAYAGSGSSYTARFDDFHLSALGFLPRAKMMDVMMAPEQFLHKDMEIAE